MMKTRCLYLDIDFNFEISCIFSIKLRNNLKYLYKCYRNCLISYLLKSNLLLYASSTKGYPLQTFPS